MSADATGLVWKWSPYQGAPFIVHLAVADVVNDAHGNEFWMSVPALAKKARVGRSTAFDALKHMIEDGFLARLESGQDEGKPSRYCFLVDNFPHPVQRTDAPVQVADGTPSRGRTHNRKEITKDSAPPVDDRYEKVLASLVTKRMNKPNIQDRDAYRTKVEDDMEARYGPKVRKLLEDYPTAPADVIAGHVDGEQTSLRYYKRVTR